MIERIIHWSLNNRVLVLFFALVLVVAGAFAFTRIDIDAIPDTTPVQVQINTYAPALSPLEIEQQVTFPIEQVTSGLPGIQEVRSISKFGLSQVTLLFDDSTDLYRARQVVAERLQIAELPDGIAKPELGPNSTGLGEVFHYLLTGEGYSLEELTTLHNWVIRPRLASVPGVAEVNTWGGEIRQFHVIVDPARLIHYGLTLDEVTGALRRNNLNVGGGIIGQGGESQILQGIGLVTNIDEISAITVTAREGTPIHLEDVARVEIGHAIRRGAATANGQGEAVLGLGFMLMGENSHRVTAALRQRLDEIQSSLPNDVQLRPVYERTELVNRVLHTVKENLQLGALLVIAVLFIFLGNLRAGLIVAAAIPLSMLFAFNAMAQAGIAASLMSLGAIDFGLIVDSSVIMVENSVRRLAAEGTRRPRIDIVRDAAIEVRKPTMFGELIIMIVFLPILFLEGVEGKLFRPMALTMIFALSGSLVLSMTLMPVLASLLLPRHAKERESILMRGLKALYRPLVALSIKLRWLTVLAALALLCGGGWLASRLGTEFIPRLSEMTIVANTVRLSGISLEESVRYGTQIEKLLLREFPDEIHNIWSRTGTAEIATDPMGVELTDLFISLHPREKWKRAQTQENLVTLMSEKLAVLPAMRVVFTQPIEMRANELVAGIRSDLGVKIFGDDLDLLRELAAHVQEVLSTIEGNADLYTEQITGQPMVEVRIDQQAIARYGIMADHALEMVEAVGGIHVGEVREGQRRFDLLVRLPEEFRTNERSLRELLLLAENGAHVPLSDVSQIIETEGPSTITREWQKRRIVVQSNVRGRDVGSFVSEAQERIAREVELPAGYHVEFGGQFEHLQRAQRRLMIIVPVALVLVLVLLGISTGSAAEALIIFTGAPFAALGGVVLLFLRDMPFNISAAIGFVAVCGVAMLNGLVMVSSIRQMLDSGIERRVAIRESALLRLRPVLMTALVASLGFVPMMLNTGIGAEIQRPLATVVVGGVVSDTILTMLVLPALYAIFGRRGNVMPPEG